MVVGIFTGGGGSFTSVAVVNVPTVQAGSVVTVPVSLYAPAGAYLGYYFTSGSIYETYVDGAAGVWNCSGALSYSGQVVTGTLVPGYVDSIQATGN